jgi:hypothetical protein
MRQAILSHRNICQSEGPVLFVRAGFDINHQPLVVVCFSRILIVWTQDKINPTIWHCIAVGETAPSWSLATTITDCVLLPHNAIKTNGALFGMITFQACGDSKRHVLYDDDNYDGSTPQATPPATPVLPMTNETLRSRDSHTVTTATCSCGDNKLLVGNSDGNVKCWEMNRAWDRVTKVVSFKLLQKNKKKKQAMPKKKKKQHSKKNRRKKGQYTGHGEEEEEEEDEDEEEEDQQNWSVVSIAGVCGCSIDNQLVKLERNKQQKEEKEASHNKRKRQKTSAKGQNSPRRSKRAPIKTDFFGRNSIYSDMYSTMHEDDISAAINSSLLTTTSSSSSSSTKADQMDSRREPKYFVIGLSSLRKEVGWQEISNRIVRGNRNELLLLLLRCCWCCWCCWCC